VLARHFVCARSWPPPLYSSTWLQPTAQREGWDLRNPLSILGNGWCGMTFFLGICRFRLFVINLLRMGGGAPLPLLTTLCAAAVLAPCIPRLFGPSLSPSPPPPRTRPGDLSPPSGWCGRRHWGGSGSSRPSPYFFEDIGIQSTTFPLRLYPIMTANSRAHPKSPQLLHMA